MHDITLEELKARMMRMSEVVLRIWPETIGCKRMKKLQCKMTDKEYIFPEFADLQDAIQSKRGMVVLAFPDIQNTVPQMGWREFVVFCGRNWGLVSVILGMMVPDLPSNFSGFSGLESASQDDVKLIQRYIAFLYALPDYRLVIKQKS